MRSKQERIYGIDLLRIVSMMMVLTLHILLCGGVLESSVMLSANYNIAWFLEIAAYCAANCYALVSGYVGIRSKHKFSGLAMLWLQVAFYSVTIAIIMHFTHGVVDFIGILKHCLPVTSTKYWYFTAYFAMWFFIPLMNTAIEFLSKKKAGIALLSVGVFLIPSSLITDAFLINGGYGLIWLCYLYLIGAYISAHGLFVGTKGWKSISVYIACVLITFSYKILSNVFGRSGNFLISYVSPLMLIAAISLLVFFINLKIHGKLIKVITFVAPLSFSVYLIHTHPLVYFNVLYDKFAFLASENPFFMVLYIVLGVIGIFIVCVFIDFLRNGLFKLLRIRQLLVQIETKATVYLNKLTCKFFGFEE